jgi:hypothetical protein
VNVFPYFFLFCFFECVFRGFGLYGGLRGWPRTTSWNMTIWAQLTKNGNPPFGLPIQTALLEAWQNGNPFLWDYPSKHPHTTLRQHKKYKRWAKLTKKW